MRILVTGSRDWKDRPAITQELMRFIAENCSIVSTNTTLKFDTDDVVIVHGGAAGADQFAEDWARRQGIKSEPHRLTREDWKKNPHAAGLLRNAEMVETGVDVCFAFLMPCLKPGCQRYDGPHYSHGATHCADYAELAGVTTHRIYR